jgi:hypothetical protein
MENVEQYSKIPDFHVEEESINKEMFKSKLLNFGKQTLW